LIEPVGFKVEGRKYYLLNIGERGRAIDSIARLLTMGSPQGNEPSGNTSENTSNASPEPLGGGGEEAGGENPFAAPEETPTEETPA
jgi:hypothetical protein